MSVSLHTDTLLTGLSMRELIHQFKWQTLVLFKCLLLQPKVHTVDVQGKDDTNLVSDAFLRFTL